MLENICIIQNSKSEKIEKKNQVLVLKENLYSINNYNKINSLNLNYILLDNSELNIFLQNTKSLQQEYAFLKYIKLSKKIDNNLNNNSNLNIEEIAKIYDYKFILKIKNLEYINLKIIEKFVENAKLEINKNKIHIYDYKNIQIKIERNIFKKILLYLKS